MRRNLIFLRPKEPSLVINSVLSKGTSTTELSPSIRENPEEGPQHRRTSKYSWPYRYPSTLPKRNAPRAYGRVVATLKRHVDWIINISGETNQHVSSNFLKLGGGKDDHVAQSRLRKILFVHQSKTRQVIRKRSAKRNDLRKRAFASIRRTLIRNSSQAVVRNELLENDSITHQNETSFGLHLSNRGLNYCSLISFTEQRVTGTAYLSLQRWIRALQPRKRTTAWKLATRRNIVSI